MVTLEMLDYIKGELARGAKPEDIRSALTASGWTSSNIDQAFSSLGVGGSAPTYSSQPSRPAGSNTGKIIVGVILAVLLLAGAGGAYAYYVYNNAPVMVFKRMLEKSNAVTSMEFSGKVKMQFEGDALSENSDEETMEDELSEAPSALSPFSSVLGTTSQKFNFTFDFNGKMDAKDQDNPRMSMTLAAYMEGLGGIGVKFGGDFVIAEPNSYMKLTEFPDFGVASVASIKGQWIKLDKESSPTDTLGLGITPGATTDKDSSKTSTTDLSKSLRKNQQKVMEAYMKYKPFTIDKDVQSEVINGVDTRRYKYTVNKEQFIKFYREIVQLSEEKLTPAEIDELVKSLDIISNMNGDIWIGKKDDLPYKMTMAMGLQDKESTNNVRGTMDITMEMKNFNVPVVVDEPKDAKTFQEISEEMMMTNPYLNQENEMPTQTLPPSMRRSPAPAF